MSPIMQQYYTVSICVVDFRSIAHTMYGYVAVSYYTYHNKKSVSGSLNTVGGTVISQGPKTEQNTSLARPLRIQQLFMKTMKVLRFYHRISKSIIDRIKNNWITTKKVKINNNVSDIMTKNGDTVTAVKHNKKTWKVKLTVLSVQQGKYQTNHRYMCMDNEKMCTSLLKPIRAYMRTSLKCSSYEHL